MRPSRRGSNRAAGKSALRPAMTRSLAFLAVALLLASTAALAQQAIPTTEQRQAAATAMRAQVAAGAVKVATEDVADWAVSCSKAPLEPAETCQVFTRML